jgi:pheromone a factor receptor
MTIHAFMKRRREMSQFLSSNAQVTFSRYFRLMALACMDTLLTIPLGAYNIWVNVNSGPDPWRGWADAHWGFSRVGTFPAILWRNDPTGRLSFNLTRSFIIVCAVVFFAFFGFADEARKNYRKVFWGVARRFGYTMPTATTRGMGTSAVRTPNLAGLNSSMGATTRGGMGAPRVYITTETKSEKRDSFLSSVGDLSSSFSISSRKSLEEKYDEKDSKQLSPASTTSSSSSSNASGSFIDMTATVASRRSFDSMRGDVESAPVTPAEEVELRGLPRLTVDAPPPTVSRGPNMV